MNNLTIHSISIAYIRERAGLDPWIGGDRRTVLTYLISLYLIHETMNALFIWMIWKVLWETNDGNNIWQSSSDILTILIALATSIQQSWTHLALIHCEFHDVSVIRMIFPILSLRNDADLSQLIVGNDSVSHRNIMAFAAYYGTSPQIA